MGLVGNLVNRGNGAAPLTLALIHFFLESPAVMQEAVVEG